MSASKLNHYFSKPKLKYEYFINKKWIERRDIFVTKERFIELATSEWKTLNDTERDNFMKTVPAPKKHQVNFFFKPISHTSTPSHMLCDKPSSSRSSSQETYRRPQETPITSNANMALVDRERFLNDKEIVMLKSMLCEIGVNTAAEKFLTKDILSDENLVRVLKMFMYHWHDFCALKKLYIGGKTKNRVKRWR